MWVGMLVESGERELGREGESWEGRKGEKEVRVGKGGRVRREGG